MNSASTPKYIKGQKVKIIPVKNKLLRSKYPRVQEYTSIIGTVVESYWIRFEDENLIENHYCYAIRPAEVTLGPSEILVPEEALEPSGSV